MDPADKDKIRNNFVFLIQNLVIADVIDNLYETEVLTDGMKEMVEVERTNRSKISKLLELLTRRGPEAYAKFIQSLNSSGQEFIARKLNETPAEQQMM